MSFFGKNITATSFLIFSIRTLYLFSLWGFFMTLSFLAHSSPMCSRYLSKIQNKDYIIETLSSNDLFAKIQAAVALSKSKNLNLDKSEQRVLTQSLKNDPSPLTRFYAAIILGRLQSPTKDTDSALLKALETDRDRNIRLRIAIDLGKRKNLSLDEFDQVTLASILSNDPYSLVRLQMVIILEKLRSSIEAVNKSLTNASENDSSVYVKRRALLVLGEKDDSYMHKSTIKSLLDDQNPSVNDQAAMVLEKTEGNLSLTPSEQISFSRTLLVSSDSSERLYTVVVLGKSESPIKQLDTIFLESLKTDYRRDVRLRLARILAEREKLEFSDPDQMSLAKLLLIDPDPIAKLQVAIALGKLSPLNEKVLLYIVSLLTHEKDSSRFFAAKALNRIGLSEEKAIKLIIPLLSHDKEYVRISALEALEGSNFSNQTIYENVVKSLNDSHKGVRVQAVKTLGKSKSHKMIIHRDLLRSLNDISMDVRNESHRYVWKNNFL